MKQTGNDILYFARTNFRNQNKLFGLKQADRYHTYITGKSGTGKTTLLETMIKQDIIQGRGLCLLDPHGDLATKLAAFIPAHRQQDVIYLDLSDPAQPFGYNPLKRVSVEKRSLVASGIIDIFEKLWPKAWGPKLEHILRHTLMALLDQKNSSIADIPTMLNDKAFRNKAMANITNEEVRNFWEKEFSRYMPNDVLPVLNKIGALLTHPAVKRVVMGNSKPLSLRKIMDTQQVVIISLAKGVIGSQACNILGSLFLTSIASAGFSRADIDEKDRIPFHVYADEFHNYSTHSFIDMMSELKKYRVSLCLANQYLHQLDPAILHAVLGNTSTQITFRIDADDASVMIKKMPNFTVADFVSLPNYHIYLILMIDGTPSKPFSAITERYI